MLVHERDTDPLLPGEALRASHPGEPAAHHDDMRIRLGHRDSPCIPTAMPTALRNPNMEKQRIQAQPPASVSSRN
ncbi:hypothetical protein Rhe02_16690 [Rhizocola hellebori]|uniref:Uncharacterized protein n=1 Tax=Rhizocola hellebori TaxID=1392758 RepID=A0A8J3Q532_9ACTN|nr:hypothetical protein Rhe02_16690 [Rhizocola hellebori]